MIELINLQKRYSARVALDLPSLRVPEGELLAIIGPNGSGKSTLLRLLSDVIEPDAGTIRMDAVRRGEIGYLSAAERSVLAEISRADLRLEQERIDKAYAHAELTAAVATIIRLAEDRG